MATKTGLVSQSIKNLKGGISQQPHMLRFPEQGTAQINGWSSETDGLQKRPPLKFIKRLGTAGSAGIAPLVHQINRDKVEQYYVVFTGADGTAAKGVRVFDLMGNEKTVNVKTGSASYLTTTAPRDDLRCVTIADNTIVINKKVKVLAGTALTDGGTFTGDDVYHDCLIAVRGGQYGRTIKITINGKTVNYINPPGLAPATFEKENVSQVIGADGKPVSPPQYIQTSVLSNDGSALAAQMPAWTDAQFIIDNPTQGSNVISGVHYPDQGLKAKLVAALGVGWVVESGPGWIHVKSPAATPITELRIDDGYANQLCNGVIHQVTSVSKLPIEAPNNYKVEITGDTTKTGDRYYVQYSALDKVWKETVGWNVIKGLDANTMPHTLIREPDGSFSFQPFDGTNNTLSWSERKAGDDDTNPMPSFIGGTFNDVFQFRNRLGLLCGENIILSQTSHFTNFFPVSVANDSDDDPIDVAVSNNRISILKFAVPFTEQLLLWSDQAQFVLEAEGILSAKTIELNLTTQFDVSDFARPFGLGQSVYFAAPRANFTSLMRYYSVQDVTAVKNAEDTSAQCPAYITNGVFAIQGTSTENFLTVLSANSPSKIFVYKYLYQQEQLVQQSWSHWDFGPDIKIFASDAINSTIYVLFETNNDLCIGTIDFTKNSKDFNVEPYRTYIDFKKQFQFGTAYDINTNTTTFKPYDIYGCTFSKEHDFLIVSSDGFVQRVECPRTQGWDGLATVELQGDWDDRYIVCGFSYEFQYTFSQFLIKKQADDGSMTSEDVGRLQLRRSWVNYQDSGPFTITTISGNKAPFRYTMPGAVANSMQAVLGKLTLPTGQFRFPCQGSATEVEVTLTSDLTTPVSIIGCGWEGVHVKRSSGI